MDRKWDIILMDMQMPILDGPEATALIRAAEKGTSRVPIIALTADGVKDHHRIYLSAGCDTVVLKPIDWGTLAVEINALVSPARGSDDLPPPPQTELVPVSAVPAQRVLDELREAIGGETLSSLVRGFIDELPGCLRDLKAGLDKADLAVCRRAAHRLKGLSSQFGAQKLTDAAHRIEVDATTLDQARAMFADVEIAATASIVDLESFLADLKGAVPNGVQES